MRIMNPESAKKLAYQLLLIGAVKLRPENPFTWASGWKSPIYCDNRKTLSYPLIRELIAKGLAEGVKERYPDVQGIAGVATGAIAIGYAVALELGLPFVYVRPEAKAHGLGNQIEGHLPWNYKIVVIEDLIATGGSSLKAVEALRSEGATVLGMGAIFSYEFSVAEENFNQAGCNLFTLSNYSILIEQAIKNGYVSSADESTLMEWRRDPANWRK